MVTMRCRGHTRLGFTLVELLVVIAIIGVLVALLLPAVQAAREAARRSSCVNKLKQMSTGLHDYIALKTQFPPGGIINEVTYLPGVSWRVLLLPFVEQQPLFNQIGLLPSGGATSWDADSSLPSLYYCPSQPWETGDSSSLHAANYAGVAGAVRAGEGLGLNDKVGCGDLDANGMFFPDSSTRIADIDDGTSNTLALGERTYVFSTWMTGATAWKRPSGEYHKVCSQAAKQLRYPINARNQQHGYYVEDNAIPPGGTATMRLNNLPFGSAHPGGANFALADASATFVSEDIAFTIYEALATIDGGEVNPREK